MAHDFSAPLAIGPTCFCDKAASICMCDIQLENLLNDLRLLKGLGDKSRRKRDTPKSAQHPGLVQNSI